MELLAFITSYKRCLLATTAAVLLLSGCSKKQENRDSSPVSVRTMKVSAGANSVGKSFMGVIEEEDGANVTFGVLGTVVRVMVEEGLFVRRGQALAEVDGQNVRNAHEISASTLRQAEDAYRRLKDLYDKGTLPEIKMVEMETALAKARAAEAISAKSVSEIVLRAPFDGYVASAGVHVGASVTPGVSGFRLVKIDRVKLKLTVPEREIGQVAVGAPVTFTVAALGDSVFQGKVVTRGVTANLVNHSYSISAIVSNPRHVLLPGMVCKARMESVTQEYSIVIPQHAIQIGGQDKYVWIVEGGKAHRRSVTTGDVTSSGVVIETGLTAGDEIIVEGQSKVSEDVSVES